MPEDIVADNETVRASSGESASSAHDVYRFSEYRELFAGPVRIRENNSDPRSAIIMDAVCVNG